MPRDGCRECSRRRITCDKGAPQCAKCLKKGIQCTGIGRQIRFVQGPVFKTKRKERKLSDLENLTAKLVSSADDASAPGAVQQAMHNRELYPDEDDLSPSSEALTVSSELHDALTLNNASLVLSHGQVQRGFRVCDDPAGVWFGTSWQSSPSADLSFNIMKPGIQMLFDHFSHTIASIMVVSDHGPNGYRDFILPLACQDDLVQRAVSVVAAFHLSARQPDLLPLAESGRSAIIKKLRTDAFTGCKEKVFNISTWATILLLLVGETVTGSQDFVHLYPMLTSLLNHNNLLTTDSSDQHQFLLQQSRMFQLFTPPLLDPSSGCETFQKDLSFYFDFLLSVQCANNRDLATNVAIYQEAIRQARNLYVKQAQEALCPDRLYDEIENLRLLVLPIQPDSPGMHTLPWVYFIAGASSRDKEHRKFFTERLMQVYEKTRMKNIIVALERLQQIWRLQPNGEWVRNPSLVNPVLII